MTPEQAKQLESMWEMYEWSFARPLINQVHKAEWLAIKARHGLTPPPAPSPLPGRERWFVHSKNTDHRKGTHRCWRFNTPPEMPQRVQCLSCKAAWTDVYTLTGVRT